MSTAQANSTTEQLIVPRSWLERLSMWVVVLGPLVAIYWATFHSATAVDRKVMFGMYVWTAWGVTCGAHRFLTHDGFKTVWPLKLLLLMAFGMAVEGSPRDWGSTHKRHHARSDTDEDPHNVRRGLIYAHFGWMLAPTKLNADLFAGRLGQDRMVTFFHRTHLLWALLGVVGIPYYFGGWHCVLYAGVIRMFLTHHVTWSINSICHQYGSKLFRYTTDLARNVWWLAIPSFGEAYHNAHHAFMRAAFHGVKWYQPDLTGYSIRILYGIGYLVRWATRNRWQLHLVWDIYYIKFLTKDTVQLWVHKPDHTLKGSHQPASVQIFHLETGKLSVSEAVA